MKLFGWILAAIMLSSPAWAAKPVTVNQLEQILNAAQHETSSELAKQLYGLELTERLSSARFAHWKARMPGESARQALSVLADPAEFLNLPPTEIPPTAAPDVAAQRKIMTQVVRYATKSVHELPNFFATRETTRFEDRPQGIYGYIPIHFVGQSSKSVVYRDGQEMVQSAAEKNAPAAAGLISWGEFGPILSTVLLDATGSKLVWSHWEQGASGPMAVFGYEVPDPKSHYWVKFCCIAGAQYTAAKDSDEEPGFSRTRVGYHGEIAVNPSTGTILRITLDAEFPQSATLTRAATMVEYSEVEIGGKNYVCPRRSVAFTLMRYGFPLPSIQSAIDRLPLKTYVNDVVFEHYHRLGAESRILGESGEELTQSTASVAAQPNPADFQAASATMVAPPAPPAAPAPAAPPEEILTLKASTRAVSLDVVVTGKNQEPVMGLGKQFFEVLEDGKPQALDYFEEHTAKPAPESDAPRLAANLYTNLPATPVVDAVNVVLIDKINTPLVDQVHVHQQLLDFLQKMKPGTKIAVFVLGSKLRLLHGFTSDGAALRAALIDPKNGDIPEKTEASRSRQDNADDQDQSDMQAVMMGGSQGRNGSGYSRSRGSLSAAQASVAGNQAGERMTMTLTALEFLARYLAGIEGRKNLIWFSSSFPVSVFPSGREQRGSLGSQNFNAGAKEASSLLALSNVAVYPVSAEGLQMDNATEAAGYNQKSIGTLGQQSDQRAIAAEAVNKLANDTGGKAFTNTNDLAGALTHAIEDGAHYYSLVYTPANMKMDGSFRKIEVRLKEGSYDLAYRRGYFADDAAAPEPKADSDPLHPLLVRGAPASSQIVFSARLALGGSEKSDGKIAGANTKLAGALTRYRVNFNLRPDDLKLNLTPDGFRTGKVQVGLLAYDEDGHAVNWAGGVIPIHIGAEQFAAAQKTGIPAHLEIDLPQTKIFLEAGVYDWQARKAGTLEIQIRAVSSSAPLAVEDFDWSGRQTSK